MGENISPEEYLSGQLYEQSNKQRKLEKEKESLECRVTELELTVRNMALRVIQLEQRLARK